jgi:hypothetical protein
VRLHRGHDSDKRGGVEEGDSTPSRSAARTGQGLVIGKEVAAAELQAAVEATHGGTATLRDVGPVRETFQGQTAWEESVHIFDLHGHPSAKMAYAWSSPIEGSDRRKFYAVLHLPPVDSPEAAVRAAIVADSH